MNKPIRTYPDLSYHPHCIPNMCVHPLPPYQTMVSEGLCNYCLGMGLRPRQLLSRVTFHVWIELNPWVHEKFIPFLLSHEISPLMIFRNYLPHKKLEPKIGESPSYHRFPMTWMIWGTPGFPSESQLSPRPNSMVPWAPPPRPKRRNWRPRETRGTERLVFFRFPEKDVMWKW